MILKVVEFSPNTSSIVIPINAYKVNGAPKDNIAIIPENTIISRICNKEKV